MFRVNHGLHTTNNNAQGATAHGVGEPTPQDNVEVGQPTGQNNNRLVGQCAGADKPKPIFFQLGPPFTADSEGEQKKRPVRSLTLGAPIEF